MYPTSQTAMQELDIAGQLNPGPWTTHSLNVANAAKIIAALCPHSITITFLCAIIGSTSRNGCDIHVRLYAQENQKLL